MGGTLPFTQTLPKLSRGRISTVSYPKFFGPMESEMLTRAGPTQPCTHGLLSLLTRRRDEPLGLLEKCGIHGRSGSRGVLLDLLGP